LITSPRPAETTIRRFIRANGLRALAHQKKRERRAFAKRFANQLWALDFMHGPKIGNIKTKLLAAIDDASRYIVLGRFLGSELFVDLAPVLRDAFERHGLPDALYADNGSAFSCSDLSLVCARLGIALIHSKPYDPESRGKIERFFRTLRARFLEAVDPAALESLEALNHAFDDWLDSDYHRRVHSGIGQTPLACFLQTYAPRRWVARQKLDLIFYRTITRKVRKDCTVSINGSRYEVGPDWIGRTIELRSPLDEPNTFILFVQGDPQMNLKPLDLIDNDRRNQRARFATSEETSS
jgi:putative transposase